MAENEGKVPKNNDSTTEAQQVVSIEDFNKITSDQKKFNEEMLENQRRIIERLDSIQKEREGRKRKREDQRIGNPVKRADTSLVVSEQPKVPLNTPFKFLIRNVFNDVSKMEEDKNYFSDDEEHFGVPWGLHIRRKESDFAVYLDCRISENIEKWSIETECDFKSVHPNGKSVTRNVKCTFTQTAGYGYPKFMKWEDMLKDYVVDDRLIVEAYVNFTKMAGVYKENLKSFDVSTEKFSDVVLNVKDEKFYVSKLYLASHSTYFEALLLGNFSESEKGEVILSGIDPYDFQKYLEVVYGENAIDEVTVEGILLIADMYDTPIVTRKCEKFLIKKSKKTMKKKLQMAARYNLDKLKNKCLSKMETLADIRAVTPGDINDMDPSLTSALLGKALSFE